MNYSSGLDKLSNFFKNPHALYMSPVKMCLRAARRTVHCIYYNPGSQRARLVAEEGRERGIRVEELDRQGLEVVCQAVDRYKEHHVHQGIVADVSKLYYQPLDYSMPQVKHSSKIDIST